MTLGNGLAWLGFWIFMAVVFYVAHVQYMAGHDTLFFTHKTDAEKKLRDLAIAPPAWGSPYRQAAAAVAAEYDVDGLLAEWKEAVIELRKLREEIEKCAL